MTVAVDQLRRVPLFQGMTDRALEALAGLADEVAFAPGDQIVGEGEDGDAFYLILDGRATVRRGVQLVRELGPGDFFGEISLVDGRPRTASIRTTGSVRAVVIRRPAFLELMDRFSAVRLGIVMALTERIRADEREALA